MKGRYKRAKVYCGGCDRSLIAVGKKCPHCGWKKDNPEPKPTKAQLINQFRNDNVPFDENIMEGEDYTNNQMDI